MVGLPVVLLWKLAALVMFHHPCFTALNPLGYQALLPANFEMSVVVSLTGVVTCSSSAEAVWTGLPGPWVDLSTFLKLALVLLAVLIWQLASFLVCPFPCPKLALPCPLPQQCLLCVHFCFFLRACPPPHDEHSLVSIWIPMRSHGIFHNAHAYFTVKSACAVTKFFHNAHAYFTVAWLWPYTHAVTLVLIETESSCGEGCFGLCPWSDKFWRFDMLSGPCFNLNGWRNWSCTRSHSKLMTNP